MGPHLIEGKLLPQVRVHALAGQVCLDEPLHALLLQTICHVVEGVLVREGSQRLQAPTGHNH